MLIEAPKMTVGQMHIVDDHGTSHWRHLWRDPYQRMKDLLKGYVLAKRQLEYYKKRNRNDPDYAHGRECLMGTTMYAAIYRYKAAIESYRSQISQLTETLPAQQVAAWKREIGPTLKFGTFGFDQCNVGLGRLESKDRSPYFGNL
jgi:hypothetical protein